MVNGKRREIGLGSAREVSLAEARELADELRKVARSGRDPIAYRDRDKRRSPTFAEAAERVHREQIVPTSKNGKHVAQWLATLEAYAYPMIGAKALHEITGADVLAVLGPVWVTKPETARRVRQRLRTVFDWALAAGHVERNPVQGVEAGLARQKDRTQHFAALPWRDLPGLWPRLVAAEGMGALALRFAILTAARSGEVRGMTWSEVDLEAGLWTVPAERMKAGRAHRVPLPAEALAILEAVRPLAEGPGSLVFPAARRGKALSDMTLAAVLKRLGVAATVHGFRSSFRDWAEESGVPRNVAEQALAHGVKDATEAAYNRADLLEQRVPVMARWASFVASAKAPANVVPLAAR
jgi:integrase